MFTENNRGFDPWPLEVLLLKGRLRLATRDSRLATRDSRLGSVLVGRLAEGHVNRGRALQGELHARLLS